MSTQPNEHDISMEPNAAHLPALTAPTEHDTAAGITTSTPCGLMSLTPELRQKIIALAISIDDPRTVVHKYDLPLPKGVWRATMTDIVRCAAINRTMRAEMVEVIKASVKDLGAYPLDIIVKEEIKKRIEAKLASGAKVSMFTHMEGYGVAKMLSQWRTCGLAGMKSLMWSFMGVPWNFLRALYRSYYF